jgi:hypothetical protein
VIIGGGGGGGGGDSSSSVIDSLTFLAGVNLVLGVRTIFGILVGRGVCCKGEGVVGVKTGSRALFRLRCARQGSRTLSGVDGAVIIGGGGGEGSSSGVIASWTSLAGVPGVDLVLGARTSFGILGKGVCDKREGVIGVNTCSRALQGSRTLSGVDSGFTNGGGGGEGSSSVKHPGEVGGTSG